MAKPNVNVTPSDELDEILGGAAPTDPVQETADFSSVTTQEATTASTTQAASSDSTAKSSKSTGSKKRKAKKTNSKFVDTLLAESKKCSSDALQRAKTIFTKKARILAYVCGTDAKIDFSARGTSSANQGATTVKEIFLKNTPPTKVESFIIKYPNSLYNLIQSKGKAISISEVEHSYDSADDIISVKSSDSLPEFFRCFTNKALIEDESIFVKFTRGGNNKTTFEHWGATPEELTPQEVQAYGDLGHPYVSMKTDFYGYMADPSGATDANGAIKLKKVNMKNAELDSTLLIKNKGITPSYKYFSCYRGTRLQAPGNYIPLKRFVTKNFATDTSQFTDGDAVAYSQAYLKSIWTRLNKTSQDGTISSQLSTAQGSYFPDVTKNTSAIATAFAPDAATRKSYWESKDPLVFPPVEHWYNKDAQGNKVRLSLGELNIVSRDIADNNKPKAVLLSNSNIDTFVPLTLRHLFEASGNNVAQLEVATLKTSLPKGRGTTSTQGDFSENLTEEQLNSFLATWFNPEDSKSINY